MNDDDLERPRLVPWWGWVILAVLVVLGAVWVVQILIGAIAGIVKLLILVAVVVAVVYLVRAYARSGRG